MARSSMTGLIGRLRRMIGDRGTPPHWTDDELQDALDVRRESVQYLRLTPSEFYPGGGRGVEWHDYYAGDRQSPVGDWEDNCSLVDASFNAVAPTSAELLVGHWYFAVSVPSLVVYLSGATYDLAAAAADVLEFWASELSRQYDVERRSSRYQRSQPAAALLRQATRLRGLQRPQNLSIERMDRGVDL